MNNRFLSRQPPASTLNIFSVICHSCIAIFVGIGIVVTGGYIDFIQCFNGFWKFQSLTFGFCYTDRHEWCVALIWHYLALMRGIGELVYGWKPHYSTNCCVHLRENPFGIFDLKNVRSNFNYEFQSNLIVEYVSQPNVLNTHVLRSTKHSFFCFIRLRFVLDIKTIQVSNKKNE